jgi:hypothetical protein
MSARNYAQTIGAGETIRLPAGRYFFVRTAAAALDITTEGNPGSPLRFIGIGAGTKFGPVEPGQQWRFLLVASAVAQNVEIIISDDGNFEVASTVTVSGTASTAELPSAALADTADTNQAINTQTVIAANLSRRRITIGVLSTSPEPVRVSQAGGAGRGIEIAPGTQREFKTTAALTVRNTNVNASGSDAVWYAEEES